MSDESIKKAIIIRNKQGLHARPAALFVQIANKYVSEILVKKDEEEVNGKSIMGILMLGAECGTEILLYAKGPDAKDALIELEKILLESNDSYFPYKQNNEDDVE